jgi:hypothetical protein
MVAGGPSPGRTPMAVPIREPSRQYRRLLGVRATAKPAARSVRSATPALRQRAKGPGGSGTPSQTANTT